MKRQLRRWALAAAPLLLAALLSAACSNTAHAPTDGDGGPDEEPGGSASYEEADLSVAAELLDTGLIKGNAGVEAAEGWRITALSVTATTPKGVKWGVIEFPSGIGSASGSEFFEVQVQELPRGDQLAIELHVTLQSEDGQTVERTAVDHWPP
jgi:hypothetical protein